MARPSLEQVLPLARRNEIRSQELAETPRWYSEWGHLFGTTSIGFVVLAVALWRLHDVRPLELLTVPVTFLLANGFEWRVHRDVLHKRFKPFQIIYERHTPMHHMVYVTDDLTIRSTKEFRLVLIPALGVLGVVIVTAPFAAGAGYLISPNCGWLLLVTASLYMVLYEVFHLSYHLPPESFIGRIGLVRVLRRHHARHHDPRLMQRWNFNVTVPLFDWLHGTIARDDTAESSPFAIRESPPPLPPK
jgi:hypothetical protein